MGRPLRARGTLLTANLWCLCCHLPHSWFCHLDDDNYLNPRALLKLLSSYSATWDVYLGKPSLNRPIRASEMLPNNQTVQPVVVVVGPAGWF